MSRSKRNGTESRDGFRELIDEIEKRFAEFLPIANRQESKNTIISGIEARKVSTAITKLMLAFRLKSSIYTPNNRNQNPEKRAYKRKVPAVPPGRGKKKSNFII